MEGSLSLVSPPLHFSGERGGEGELATACGETHDPVPGAVGCFRRRLGLLIFFLTREFRYSATISTNLYQ
jgi:hypothetical protein